jgi:hypothetical protein
MASDGKTSHKAIWDDSALVDSWNDAVEEYKVRDLKIAVWAELTFEFRQKYHSIKARGENAHEVLKAAENERNET